MDDARQGLVSAALDDVRAARVIEQAERVHAGKGGACVLTVAQQA